MEIFDLALAYTWEYDEDFIQLIEDTLQASGISTFRIREYNRDEVTQGLLEKEFKFNFFLDRASDADENFESLAKILSRRRTVILNDYPNVDFATDKATMHLEFISKGINTPYTIIISPFSKNKEIEFKLSELTSLGRPFIIKPANTTGGGIGVVTGAESLGDVLLERQRLVNDKYLLQRKIIPLEKDGRRFWFRCFWAFGKIFNCWWNDITHYYEPVIDSDIKKYNLRELYKIVSKINNICGLDFFSTEIALTPEDKFIVVDYVNDQCDMRFQSKHLDGVPDEVIYKIVFSLRDFIQK